MTTTPAEEQKPPLPLDAHLGHLDRVLGQARVLKLLLALQRQREIAEERSFFAS